METDDMIRALECMREFRSLADEKRFKAIFGYKLGSHLWSRFEAQRSDVIKFFCSLSTDSARLLAGHFVAIQGIVLEIDDLPPWTPFDASEGWK